MHPHIGFDTHNTLEYMYVANLETIQACSLLCLVVNELLNHHHHQLLTQRVIDVFADSAQPRKEAVERRVQLL